MDKGVDEEMQKDVDKVDFSQPCPSCCSRGLITNQGSFVTRQGGRLDLLGIGTHHIFVFCFSNALNFLLYRKLVQPFHFCLSLGISTKLHLFLGS